LAKKIGSYPPQAVKNTKQALIQGLNLRLEGGLKLEQRLFALTSTSFSET